ncbi:MAG: hypothetical protein HC936_06680 [Leptolyngbyaceae cyanobacterium SU_3_3]|nr:hypothetical protein [Leptolyngbyaceae cyanobacterium SU_3_3]
MSDQRAAAASQPTGASREPGNSQTIAGDRNGGDPCNLGGSSQPVSARSLQGIDLDALAEAIASIESAGSGGYQQSEFIRARMVEATVDGG